MREICSFGRSQQHVTCAHARALGLQIQAVTIDTVCSRQCSLKMSASEEAAQNIDQTSSKKNPPKQKSQYRREVLEFHSHYLAISWRVFGG